MESYWERDMNTKNVLKNMVVFARSPFVIQAFVVPVTVVVCMFTIGRSAINPWPSSDAPLYVFSSESDTHEDKYLRVVLEAIYRIYHSRAKVSDTNKKIKLHVFLIDERYKNLNVVHVQDLPQIIIIGRVIDAFRKKGCYSRIKLLNSRDIPIPLAYIDQNDGNLRVIYHGDRTSPITEADVAIFNEKNNTKLNSTSLNKYEECRIATFRANCNIRVMSKEELQKEIATCIDAIERGFYE
jgi:hypothetical protein